MNILNVLALCFMKKVNSPSKTSSFQSVRVLDPLPAFCDDTYCWAIKDKKLLYRDSGHLSEVGAIYLGRYFQHYLSNDSK